MSGTIVASTINAGASSPLVLQSNSVTGITLDTSQNTTFAGSATFAGTAVMASSFRRNRLINGNMAIDQRNSGASQTITAAAALAYTVDRWYAYCTGANVTGQQVAGATAGQYRYQFTGAASVTAIGFAQRIETLNSADLSGTTATLSVDMSNSLLTTVTWTAYYANTSNTFGTLASPTVTSIATGTFTVTSSIARYSANISIPSAAVTGIQILFTVGAQTSGTWVIGNVQLEPGALATPYEYNPTNDQLAQCQRYYLRYTSGASNARYALGRVDTTSTAKSIIPFPVLMRVAPATFTSSLAATFGIAYAATTSTCTVDPAYSDSTTLCSRINFTTTATMTVGQGVEIFAANAGYLAWSSEL